MKTLILSMLSIFLLNVNAKAAIDEQDPMRSKMVSKSFNLNQNDKINLANQYGAITIKTWDKKEIKVDAEIKAYASTTEEAEKLLAEVAINAAKNEDLITIKTNISEKSDNWGIGSKNGKKWHREVKVYFTVYMPSTNALTASQAYGNITIDDFSAPTSLKVQYGNLIAGDLSSVNNYINVQYGKATLKDINTAKIKLQYGGGITIASVNDLELNAQYTSVQIGTVKGNATIKHQYGSGITIGIARNLNLDVQYAGIKLTTLNGKADVKVQYGKLSIEDIENSSNTIHVVGDYSGIILGFNSSYGGQFSISTNYGGFKYGDNVNAKLLGDNKDYKSSKNYAGQIGNGISNKVDIRTNYGSVIFK